MKLNKDYYIVCKKDSKLMKFIAFLVRPFCRNFMTGYYTTIAKTIYKPTEKDIPEGILLHELVHIKQWKKYGLWFWFSFIFLFPTVITMRSMWEREAYEVSMDHFYKTYCTRPDFNEIWSKYKIDVADNFTSSKYLWMNPFDVRVWKWIKKCEQKLQDKYLEWFI